MIFWVKYSQNLDLRSYINKIWKKAWVDYGDKSKEYNYRYGPKEFIDELTDAKDEKSAEKVVRRYWQKTLPPSFEKDNVFLIKWFERFLNEEKDLIIGRLEKVYGEKFPFDEITVYLTTCPFFSIQLRGAVFHGRQKQQFLWYSEHRKARAQPLYVLLLL